MPAITIRDVPVGVRDELAARAARAGQSLQEYLRAQLVEAAGRPTVDDALARARARLLVAGAELTTQEILGDLAAERR
ncbi:MAG: hypothetical protein FJW88_01600 [Actinobacteria bacterium]|nr:hypothetical protein [Actinomycetota bacterium]